LISVLGGKITGYRAIAEDVTDAVCRRVGAPDRRSATAASPLPGARGIGQRPTGVDRGAVVAAHLYDLYGTTAAAVLALARSRSDLDRPLSPSHPDIGAQVVHGVRHEYCVRLSDFMKRRTLLGASRDQGWDAAEPAAALMASELGWSAAHTTAEIESYRRELAAAQAFRNDT
jgi:glycerol-3-phosphate dehydrogenase